MIISDIPSCSSDWIIGDSITLRDYFAGQALIGILSSTSIPNKEELKKIGIACYEIANKMMEARSED